MGGGISQGRGSLKGETWPEQRQTCPYWLCLVLHLSSSEVNGVEL